MFASGLHRHHGCGGGVMDGCESDTVHDGLPHSGGEAAAETLP
jgi:hypothetical protein